MSLDIREVFPVYVCPTKTTFIFSGVSDIYKYMQKVNIILYILWNEIQDTNFYIVFYFIK